MDECQGCGIFRKMRIIPQWPCEGDGCTVFQRNLELLLRLEVERVRTFIQRRCPDAEELLEQIDMRLKKTSVPSREAVAAG